MTDTDTLWNEAEQIVETKYPREGSSAERTRRMMQMALELLEEHKCRKMLVDISDAPMAMPDEIRNIITEYAKKMQLDRQAFVVRNPVIRMLARTLSKLAGSASIAKYFAERQDALAYLREG